MSAPSGFFQRIHAETPHLARLSFREAEETELVWKQGEAILDLNGFGNWVRGLEMLGGSVPFSLRKAVEPLGSMSFKQPLQHEPGTVTYDPEVDAAFIYLRYDAALDSLTAQEQIGLKTVSHSINPSVTYGLDLRGGLVCVGIPVADVTGSIEQFLRLLQK